jgi:hypothetical protein
MSNWTDPIDDIPQVPADWANHIIYGGLIGVALLLAHLSPLIAVCIVLVLGAIKKTVDFIKEDETFIVCLGKTWVGALFPALILLLVFLHIFTIG